jgi:hypothetical protein
MQKLANGYTVLDVKAEERPGQMTGTIVLAVNDSWTQFATWWKRDSDQATFHGDYYQDEAQAREAFVRRTGYYV